MKVKITVYKDKDKEDDYEENDKMMKMMMIKKMAIIK